jgi:hypothetical protein
VRREKREGRREKGKGTGRREEGTNTNLNISFTSSWSHTECITRDKIKIK